MTAVLMLALLLRLVRLNDSFWLDEAAQVLESARPLAEQLQIAGDFQPPLMHLVTFFWLRFLALFGAERIEALVRFLPSVIPGIISVWTSYQLALQIGPTPSTVKKENQKRQSLALMTALFIATSPLHIFYSQELRPYSLAMMWGGLSLLSLFNWTKAASASQSPSKAAKSAKSAKKSGAGFMIFNILGLYTSYLYPFWLLMQLAYLLIVKKIPWPKLIWPVSLMVIAFLPWLPKLFEQLSVGQQLQLQMPGWSAVVSLPQLKSLPLVPLKFIYGQLNIEGSAFFVISALLIFGSLAWLLYQQRTAKDSKPVLTFALYFFLAPLLLIWLFSFLVPVLQPKRVLFLLPAFFICISYLIVYTQKQWQTLARLLFIILFAIHLFSLLAYWTKPELQRENWRSLVAVMEADFAAKQAVAVFSFDAPFAPFVYYSHHQLATFATGSFYLPAETDLANQVKSLADYQVVLLFDYLRDLSDPNDQLPALIQDLGFRQAGVYDYPNIGFVRIYTKNRVAYEYRLRCQ